MDPDQTLTELRAAAAQMRDEGTYTGNFLIAASTMLEAFEALDNWMSNGGFLPTQWQHPRVVRATITYVADTES